ncbi:MAG: VWA-like domain-containing protein, partial [Nanopusillaceae archaeon]
RRKTRETDDPQVIAYVTPEEIVYNPQKIKEIWGENKMTHGLAFVLTHEILHVLNKHFERRVENIDGMIQNIAMDCAIHNILEDYITEVEKNYLVTREGLNKKIKRKIEREDSFEEILSKIKEENIRENEGGRGFLPLEDHEVLKRSWKGKEIEKEKMRQELEKGIREEMGRKAGQGMVGLEKILEILKKKDPTWKRILKNIIGSIDDEKRLTYDRPNRKREVEEILPGIKREEDKVKVIVAIDTSGSIFNNKIWYEKVVNYLQAEERIEIERAYYFEDGFFEIKPSELKKSEIKIKGGGGTDINPLFQKIKDWRGDLILVFTDGELFGKVIKTKTRALWLVIPEGKESLRELIKDRPLDKIVEFDEE